MDGESGELTEWEDVVEAGEDKSETEGLGWVDGELNVVFRLVMNIHGLIQVRWRW